MVDKNTNQQADRPFVSLFSSSATKPENDFDDILSRMKAACNAENDKKLAVTLGVKYSAIAAARKRNTITPAWLLIIADKTGTSVDWLRTGEGEIRRRQDIRSPNLETVPQGGSGRSIAEQVPRYNGEETLICHDCEVTLIPMVEARLSAGSGSWETSDKSDRRYAFRSDFLRRKGNAKAMVLMRVAGDSMEPAVMDNDVVLIDTSNTTPRPGRLFAVAVEELVYLKKVNAEPGKLVLTSANPAYGPLEIDARGDLNDGIKIIGKAVWVGRELD